LTTLSITPARTSSALLVTAGVLWGTGGLAGAVLASAGHLHPVTVATYRLLVGGGCAVTVVAATGGLRHLRAHPVRLLVSGALLAQFQAAYQVAVAVISVSLATLITIGCVPVCVAAVGALRERRLPAGRALGAVAGSLAGLALLCGTPVGADGWRTAAGVGLSLLAGAGFAALTLIAARPVAGQGAITAAGLLVGGLLLTPFALVYGMAVPLTWQVVALAAYLGVVPTAVAYGAYFLGLRHAGATAAALATVLEPLTATLLAVAFHGERLTAAGVLGTAAVAGSLALYYAPSRGGVRGLAVR
jgi:DME family drug/metabolite transporter